MPASVYQLHPSAKSYEWGPPGSRSKVAQFAQASPPFDLAEDKPYAELWMGTHPSGPSDLLHQDRSLKDELSARPELSGSAVTQAFGDDLPFLFKILSISKALSIQAHPDKMLAARLHSERGDIYKDSNHKPEMAIAISPFEAFCGFLPPNDIATHLTHVREFASLLPDSVTAGFVSAAHAHQSSSEQSAPGKTDPVKNALRDLFAALMTAPTENVQQAISTIRARYETGSVHSSEKPLTELFIRLDQQFPGDVGVLCIFILNIVRLKPGEAIFLQANEPHAYLSGDIVETMATSDNVVRAGLTPKLRDVDTLVSMLTYSYRPASEQLLKPTPFRGSKFTLLYDPPIAEFSVLTTRLGPGESEGLAGIPGPSILIVTEGEGSLNSSEVKDGSHEFKAPGEVFFIGCDVEVKLSAAAETGLTAFRAFATAPSQ